ncbi:MAG: SIS domain-containing protein [Betaproteobacteria bacterium]
MQKHIQSYAARLANALSLNAFDVLPSLIEGLSEAWKNDKTIFFCGNGGSAGNAIHLANDFIYGAGLGYGKGLRVEALSANPAVLTCLANDIGYENIFSEQIRVKGNVGDVLIVLSGSGNSPNILKVLETGNALGLKTFAVLGFDGGKAKVLDQFPIHFPVQDMQISEDLQLIVGHMCMQWLCANPPQEKST